MPRRRLTCLASLPETSVSRLSRRVRVEGFFSRMWFMKARRRRILPVPVILKRFAAPLSVFIFGIGCLSLALSGIGGGGRRRRGVDGAVGGRCGGGRGGGSCAIAGRNGGGRAIRSSLITRTSDGRLSLGLGIRLGIGLRLGRCL